MLRKTKQESLKQTDKDESIKDETSDAARSIKQNEKEWLSGSQVKKDQSESKCWAKQGNSKEMEGRRQVNNVQSDSITKH